MGQCMEGHKFLLTHLLLVAFFWWCPLALAFLDLEKAHNQLPRVTLWCVLAEELKVPEDIRAGIKDMYF